MNKNSSWPVLKKAPVIMAVFQLQLEKGCIDVPEYVKYDHLLRKTLPKMSGNIEANINMPGTPALGVSKVTGTSNAKIASYTYFSDDQKTKLSLSADSFTFTDESEYQGWDSFVESVIKYLDTLAPLLVNQAIKRVSIRFINRFTFQEFDDPTEYFKTTVSTTDENGFGFSVARYNFCITLQVPDKDMYSIVNQSVEAPASNKYFYIFDIDVLERKNLIFDKESILESMSELRAIKNKIFFDNLTQKTQDLCN